MARPITTEIWSDWQCAGGTRLARVPFDQYLDLDLTRRLTLDHTLTGAISKSAPAYGAFQSDRVQRIVYDDVAFDHEWRLHTLDDASGSDGESGILRYTATPPLMDLRDYAELQWVTGTTVALVKTYDGVTLTQLIDDLLPMVPSYWARGTVTPTVLISLQVAAGSTFLEVIRAGVAAAIAEGVDCELNTRRNSTTGYYLDVVTQIGAGAGTPDIRSSKNLLGMKRQRTIEPVAQKVIPLGTNDVTISRAYLRIASVSGSDVELRIPETGAAAIQFDDQFNGHYLERADGSFVQITDCVASTSKATLSAIGTCAQHDLSRIVANSSGKDVVALAKPGITRPRRRILKLPQFSADHNIVRNPYVSTWTGASSVPPDGYVSAHGTISRNTDPTYIRRGIYSCRIQGSTIGASMLRTPTQSKLFGMGNAYCARISFYLAAGRVKVRVFQVEAGGVIIGAEQIVNTTGSWFEYEWLNMTSVGSMYVEVLCDLASTDVYCDAFQISPGATSTPWTLGCEASSLLARGNTYLRDFGSEGKSFTISLADWQKVAPAEFPYDTLDLGLTARVRDTELNEGVSARIVELRERLRRPTDSSVVILTTTPSDFVRKVAKAL